MTQIQIISINRQVAGYIELTYKMSFTLPAIWGTGANPIVGLDKIVAAYSSMYGVEVIPVTGTVVTLTQTQSVPNSVSQATIRTQLQNIYATNRALLDGLTLDAWDNAAGQSWDGAIWGATNLITDNPVVDSVLGVTATGSAAAAVTLTIPAVAGKFHNILSISITAYTTLARTGNATPVVVTSTNLPGNQAWTFATAAAIGTTDIKKEEPKEAIKSLVSNTATTIVCPATTSVIWRVQVYYKTV